MAKDRRKVSHIHSKVQDRQPTPASLEYGEIGVNYNAGHEFISMKNSDDNVVRISSDGQMVDIMERKTVIPYSGNVDNVDLEGNRSNIEIKFNQVVASATTKHDVVNGARDIDGDIVNPTTDSGLTNGAGFAIDMSRYAMIGANPSFSSVTTTDGATLKGDKIIISGGTLSSTTTGNTVIRGGENSKLILSGQSASLNANGVALKGNAAAIVEANGNVRVESINYGLDLKGKSGITISTSGETLMNSSGNTCIDSEYDANFYGRENTNIGVSCGGEITQKVRVEGDNVIIDATTNNVGITAYNDIDVSSEKNININANNDVCIGGGNNVSLFGVEETNIGVNCGGFMNSSVINIKGNNINIDGDSYFSGKTYFNNTCTAITSNELSDAFCEIADKMTPKTLTLEYGQTCNESGSVDYNTAEAKTITIPATIAHITCGDIVDSNAGTSGAVITSNAQSTTINSSGTTTLNAGINKTGSLEIDNTNARLGSSGTTILGAYGYGPSGLEVGDMVYVQSKGSVHVESKNVDIVSSSGMTVSSIEKLNVGSVNGRTSVSGFSGVDIDGNFGGVSIKGYGVALRGNEGYVSSRYKTCIDSSGETRVYGAEETVVGKSCDDEVGSATTIIGRATTISGETVEVTGNSVSLSGNGVNIYSPSNGTTTLIASDTIIYSSDKTVIKGGQGSNLTLSGQSAILDTNLTSIKGYAFAEIIAGAEVHVYGTGSTSTVNVSGGTTNVNGTSVNVSGATTNVNGTSVNVSGATTEITSKNATTISSSSGPVCIEAADVANLYGKSSTNVGISCNGTKTTGNTVVYGENTEVIGATSVTVSGRSSVAISGGSVNIDAIDGINIIAHTPAPGVGNINISTGERLTLYGENTDISGRSNVNINSNYKVNVKSYGTGVQSVDISAISGGTRLSTYKDLDVRTTGDTSIVSNGNTSISGSKTTVEGGGQGAKLTISGQSATLNANYTSVKGSSFAEITANGEVRVHGTGSTSIVNVSGETTNVNGTTVNISGSSVNINGTPVNVVGDMNVSGTVTANNVVNNSDRNLKENIRHIEPFRSNRASRIPLMQFNFKDDETKRLTYGVIAQEVQACGLTELVHRKDDDTLGVDYTSFLILRVDSLEHKVNDLYKTINELTKRIEELEKGKDDVEDNK